LFKVAFETEKNIHHAGCSTFIADPFGWCICWLFAGGFVVCGKSAKSIFDEEITRGRNESVPVERSMFFYMGEVITRI
jgi:hypothetical protein